MSSLVNLMTEWHVCATKNRETTCVGPFKTISEADDFYNNSDMMKSMTTCTLFTNGFNPSKRYTVNYKNNDLINIDVKLTAP